MLSENIKKLRKAKGLSQEELAIKLNVVRQTVSKWENGLSVPDSALLISLAEELDTSVSELLGETVTKTEAHDTKAISEKLEVINLQLAKQNMARLNVIRGLLIGICIIIVGIFIALIAINGSYLNWNYDNPELAVGFEFIFVRIAPIILICSIIGIFTTYRKK